MWQKRLILKSIAYFLKNWQIWISCNFKFSFVKSCNFNIFPGTKTSREKKINGGQQNNEGGGGKIGGGRNKEKGITKMEHFSTLFLFAFYWEILSESIAQ